MEQFRGKKVLVVGLGKTGFALINFFNNLECKIKVTDIRPIFDLNKAVKKLKKVSPTPEMTLGEHRAEDFLEADVIVYGPSVNPNLPQLNLARSNGKQVFSEFALGYHLCEKPVIAICGNEGRTTIAHMIGYALRAAGNNVYVGGSTEQTFIEYFLQPNYDQINYVIIEASENQLHKMEKFHPFMVVYPSISERYSEERFRTQQEYLETVMLPVNNLTEDDYLIVNFDKLSNNVFFRNSKAKSFWYSRKSFVKAGVANEIQGTHFHDKRIHSNIHCHSEFRVNKMRILGANNRENLLAAITACKIMKISDDIIQQVIEKFPGIPHRVEFVTEKNGVRFYNDSKSETMEELSRSLSSMKQPVILIAGGKDTEQDFAPYADVIGKHVRILVLIGEAKENMNRAFGSSTQTFLVGSFDESILIAYQKSRTGDIVVMSPGNSSTDIFRDFEERGNYFKKIVFQL